MKLLLSLLLNALLVYVAAQLLDGVSVDGYGVAIVAAIVLGLVNFFIRPVLKLLALPITLLTLGLFLLVINGAMVLLADHFVAGFNVDGILWAILFSILLSVMNFFVGK